MSQSSVRVPQIKSEIAVAIAFLGWNLRQLVEYAELIGLPIGELFLEDALEEPWPEFRSKADPIRVENLTRLLGGLGVGLRDDVFGVIRHLQARVTFSQGNRPIGALMALAANYSQAPLRLALQHPAPGDAGPTAALLINPGNRFLLCDHLELDSVELISKLYANCLNRLWVADYRISSLASLTCEVATSRLLKMEFRSALHLSKARVIDLLNLENCP